jgi:hypothetical protein
VRFLRNKRRAAAEGKEGVEVMFGLSMRFAILQRGDPAFGGSEKCASIKIPRNFVLWKRGARSASDKLTVPPRMMRILSSSISSRFVGDSQE